MSDKHTPGPWKFGQQYGQWFVRQDPKDWDGGGYQHVCNLPAERKGNHYGDMFAANARLIAAAPELLDALRDLLDVMTGKKQGDAIAVQNAQLAINKATGEVA